MNISTIRHFSIKQPCLFYSFPIQEEEREKIDGILALLDDLGGARRTAGRELSCAEVYNLCRMFAVVILAFALVYTSLREMESACMNDLMFIYVFEGECPTHATSNNFINRAILPLIREIYAALTNGIFRAYGLSMDTSFIDRTKFEADANRYKFVWKLVKYRENLDAVRWA